MYCFSSSALLGAKPLAGGRAKTASLEPSSVGGSARLGMSPEDLDGLTKVGAMATSAPNDFGAPMVSSPLRARLALTLEFSFVTTMVPTKLVCETIE